MGLKVSAQSRNLKAGEWVIVRSKEEILATLDKNGRLEELPFMPQMLQYCGQRLRVAKRAHKLCDTQFDTAGRTMKRAVLLEGLRCDGNDFGGCQLSCALIWKESWLKRADDIQGVTLEGQGAGCTESELRAATALPPSQEAPSRGPRYVCQATQMTAATDFVPFWSLRHFIEDYTSGNERIGTILGGIFVAVYWHITESGLGFGSALRWIYDKVQGIRGRTPYVHRRGHLPMNSQTPTVKLNLQPGELVKVKSHKEILNTVRIDLVNRGMGFHAELVQHCGKTARVKSRVSRIIDEKTGHLTEMKTPCIVLDGVECTGRYVKPLFCTKNCHPYWREIWLERVSQGSCGDDISANNKTHSEQAKNAEVEQECHFD